MGINWGIALGAAAKSGVDTYERLNEEQRRAEREKREQEEFEWRKKAQDDERKLAEIYGQTIGAGDTRQVADQAAMQDPNSNFNQYQGEDGPAVPTKGIAYSSEDKRKDFYTQAAAAGVNPLKVQQAALGDLQYSGAARGERKAGKMEAFENWHADVQDKLAKGDYASIYKDNLDLYNKPKKGSMFDDGNTADVVASHDGKSFSLVRKDGEGNIISSTPITRELVESQLDKIAFAKYQSLDYKGGTELGLKKQEMGIKQQEADTHRGFYGPGGTYERVHKYTADAAKDRNSGNSIKARATEYADALVASGENDPKTGKPWTKEAATKYAYAVAVKDPNAKNRDEWKISQDGSFRQNADGVVQDWDPKANTWKTRGLPVVTEAAAKAGVVADVDKKTGRPAFKGADGWYSSEQEAYTSFKNAKKPGSEKPSALPVEDTKKYIRSKSPRGGYTYTESPRGLTKQQYAEMDNK